MFIALFGVSIVLALAVSITVAWLSKDVIESILHRFLADKIGTAVSKYLRFALVVVGISEGVRIRALREYIFASAVNRPAMVAELTPETWVLELYRTALGTLEGILLLLVLFAFLAIVGITLIRKAQLKDLLPTEKQA